MNSECPVSYTPVKPSWLKASTFRFCSPFSGYCWLCDFYFVWSFGYFTFFKSQLSVYEPVQHTVVSLCSPFYPAVPQVHCLELWTGISSGKRSHLRHFRLFCYGENHSIHTVSEIQWSDSCFLS